MPWINWILLLSILACLKIVKLQAISVDTYEDMQHSVWGGETLSKPSGHRHHISKRSAPDISLQTTGHNEAATSVRVGDWIGFMLTMTVQDTGPMQITIDISGSSIYYEGRIWAIFSICNPVVSATGDNIEGIENGNIVAVMSDSAGDGRYNKATIYLGQFNRGTTYATADANDIIITFDALTNFSPGFAQGDVYNITVEVDYGGTYTWLDSVSYTGVTDGITLTSATYLSFNLDGPDLVMKGTTSTWALSMTLRNAASVLVVDVYSPLNQSDILSICSISIASRGDSYACYPKDGAAQLFFDEPSDGNNLAATLDFGNIINSKFWEGDATDADDTINIEINVKVLNSSEAIADSQYFIGVSVELDNINAYSTEAFFSVFDGDVPTDEEFPTIDIAAAHASVVWGKPSTFYVNLTIPEGQSDTYYAEFVLPVDGTAVMNTCDFGVDFYYIGHNFPCVDSATITYDTMSTGAGTGEYDYIRIDYGLITNTGSRSGADDNTIVLEFRALVMHSHVNLTSGENVTIAAGIKLGGPTAWVGEVSVTILDNPEPPTEEPEVKHYSAMNSRDASILYEGGSTAEMIAIRIPPSSILRDVNITVKSSEIDGSPVLDICELRVYQYGSSLHDDCLDASFTLTWTNGTRRVANTDSYVTNEATLVVDWIINGAYGNYWWNVNETTLYVLVNVLATSHPGLIDGTDVTFDVLVDIGGGSVVTETVTLTYQTSHPTGDDVDDAPLIYLEENDNNLAFVGGIVSNSLDIYTTPRTINKLSIEVATADSSPLAICRISVRTIGGDVSCIANDYQHGATYTAHDGNMEICTAYAEANGNCYTSLYDFAVLDLGNVASFGQHARVGNDSLTIIGLVIDVQFHEDMTTGVNYGDLTSYTVGVYIGDTRVFIDSADIELSTAAPHPSSTAPVFNFEKYNLETAISRGGGALFIVEVYTPPAAMHSYFAEIHSPLATSADTSKAGLGNINVTSSRWNVPCLNDKHISKVLESTDADSITYDTATVQFGNIVNSAPSQIIDVTDEENMFTMEVVVCVPTDSAATDGEELAVSTTFTVSSHPQWSETIPYTVSDALIQSETAGYIGLSFAEAYPVPTVHFGEETRRTIRISTVMLTADVKIHFELPSDGSSEALLTVTKIHISHVGGNFPCHTYLHGQELEVDNEHLYGNSHDHEVQATVGRITNVGTSVRYQFESYSPDDDVIELTYFVVASQHSDNIYTPVATQEYMIYLERNGVTDSDTNLTDTINIGSSLYIPTPDMQVFSTVDEDAEIDNRLSGDSMSIYIRFNHTSNSTGHAYNARLNVFAPDFMRYDAYEGMDLITYTAANAVGDDDNSATFEMTEIYFTDNQTLTINYTIDPDATIVRGQDVHVVIPVNLLYYGRDVNDALGEVVDITTVLEFDIHIPECTDTLGMETGAITDCQITWSSSLEGFNGTEARLNSDAAWKPGYRGEPFWGEEYIEFSFGNLTRVSGVTVQPPQGTTDWVVTFKLQYSHYAIHWFTVEDEHSHDPKIFDISDDILAGPSEVYLELTGSDVIEARHVRFVPVANSNNDNLHGVRLELHGCAISSDVAADVCAATASGSDSHAAYERGWLMDQDHGHLYVCILSDIDDYVSCSHTSDFGASWESIDAKIVNINLLRRDTSQLYGLARNRVSLMRSDDWGANWCSVTQDEYDAAEASSQVINVQRLPFEDWTQTSLNDLNVQFGFDFNSTVRWTVSPDGVNKMEGGSWTLVSYWSTEEWDMPLNDDYRLVSSGPALWFTGYV